MCCEPGRLVHIEITGASWHGWVEGSLSMALVDSVELEWILADLVVLPMFFFPHFGPVFYMSWHRCFATSWTAHIYLEITVAA